MKSKDISACCLCIVAAGFLYNAPVVAQTVDYGTLEALFGEPITTSATGTPQRASDAPANITIITADEIRQSGSRNIPEILSRVPGLDVLQEGVNSYDIGVRGYQQAFQPRLLVLLDGRQVFNDDYSRTIWDNIPVNIDDIRQIEVVKGAASALYGSNAAGGVINIITYSPLYDKNRVADITAGTQNTISGDATETFNGSWGGTKFSAGGMDASEFNTTNVSGDQNPPYIPQHQYIVNSSVFQLSPDVQANTEATYSNSTANLVDGLSDVMAAQKTMSYSLRAGASWQSPYGTISSNNYFNYDDVNFFEPEDGGLPYGLKTQLFVSQLQDQFKIGRDNTFRAALEYRYKVFTDDGSDIVSQSPDLHENHYAVSGMWAWQVTPKLSWTNALRVEQQSMWQTGTLSPDDVYSYASYSHINNAWSANSDLVYKATDLDTIGLGYGRGVMFPSLIQSGFDLIFNFNGSPEDSEGNPDLKPTIVQDLDINYDRKLPLLFSLFRLSAFYEYNRDIADISFFGNQPGTGYPVFVAENVGNSQGGGGEIQFKGNKSGFRWDASYSATWINDDEGVAGNLGYQTTSPTQQYRLLLGYSMGPWEFDTNNQYVNGTSIPRSYDGGFTSSFVPTDGYYSLSGRVGYKINDNYILALSGTNLTQKYTTESPYPAIERQVFLSLTGKF